jgi:uncharacterized protein YjbJ (UPF0337 family)
MNKNQAHGMANEVMGKVQEQTGKLIGSKAQQAKGLQKQVAGHAEEKLGDAKAAIKRGSDAIKHANSNSR